MTPWRPAKPWKKRQQIKVKISWQRLGLRDPIEEKMAVPIEEMRRQVEVVAREGLLRGIRSDSTAPGDNQPRRSRGKKTKAPRDLR